MPITERDLFLHAAKSHELLQKAVQTFSHYLEKKLPPKSEQYYQARSYLKQGQGYLDETLKKAKLLLGPVSPYSPQEVEKQRAQLLIENKIIARGLNLNDLREELVRDEFLKTIFSPEEVAAYLKANFISQSSGQRRLANIKVRMIIDRLQTLRAKGQELQTAAQKYFQSG
jgi:hypothetical protein